MPQRLRYYPANHLVEVVTRIRDGRLLLTPQEVKREEDDLHAQMLGSLERYRKKRRGKIFGLHLAGNHRLTPDWAAHFQQQLSAFRQEPKHGR